MNYIIKNLMLLTFVLMLVNCADMNDIHQGFLDRGERIYVGRVDSLTVFGGYHRVKITGKMIYAKTAEKCIIRWSSDGVKDSVIVQADEWKANNDTLSVIIEGLEEGTQRFFIQTYDKENHKSLNIECNGNVYGDQYILSASPKIITRLKPMPEGMELTWNTSEEAIGVEIKYESNNGEKNMQIDGQDVITMLPDWKLSGKLQARTTFLPETGAIDTLYSPWSAIIEFPDFVEFSVNKSTIKHITWNNDAITGYSGTYGGVFDGIFAAGGNQFHSSNGVGVPQHLTFDLNVNANLTRFELYARDDNYHNWNPKVIQLWGIEEINENSKLTLSSMNADWENEARAKGWKLLTEDICSDPIKNNLIISNPQTVRYIIIRTTQVYGGPSTGSGAYVILREVTLFADSILPVK